MIGKNSLSWRSGTIQWSCYNYRLSLNTTWLVMHSPYLRYLRDLADGSHHASTMKRNLSFAAFHLGYNLNQGRTTALICELDIGCLLPLCHYPVRIPKASKAVKYCTNHSTHCGQVQMVSTILLYSFQAVLYMSHSFITYSCHLLVG